MQNKISEKGALEIVKATNESSRPNLDVNEHEDHAYAAIRAVRQQMGPLLRSETEQALINYPRAKKRKVLRVLKPMSLNTYFHFVNIFQDGFVFFYRRGMTKTVRAKGLYSHCSQESLRFVRLQCRQVL